MLLRALCLLVFVTLVTCDATCPGTQPNNNPFYTQEPTLVRSVKNGKLFKVGVQSESLYPMFVLHTWGTPYEQGFAQGSLLKNETGQLIKQMFERIGQTLDEYLQWLPERLRVLVERYGLDFVLDLTYEATRFYTPKYWEEEMRGLSEASGVSYNDILRMHMLPELIKAGCSMFTAYGPATPKGNLLQLRALDWDVHANLQIFSTVHVRHPNDDGSWGHAFATLGWAGYLSGLTGMSSNGMAISEKYGDEVFGGDSRIGYPFNYVLRDIIQFDDTLDSAITRLIKTKRTCSIYIGVGDQKLKTGRLFQYSAEELIVWDDKNQWNTTKHPQLDNVVYQGVRTTCFHDRLKMYSSKSELTPQNTIQNVIPFSRTGDLHAAVYDFENNVMLVSNAKPLDQVAGPANAFERTFIKLDMTKLFGEPKPTN